MFFLCCQAGLLGCEAVLSSMALMQANNIPGQKRMMSSLSQGHRASPESLQTHSQHSHSHNHHGHQGHHGQAHHSHMGHPSAGSCPPLVRSRKLVRKGTDSKKCCAVVFIFDSIQKNMQNSNIVSYQLKECKLPLLLPYIII